MPSIEFEQDNEFIGNPVRKQDSTNSAFVRFLIRKGYVRTADQASFVLLCIAATSFLLMLIILYFFVFSSPSSPELTPEEINNQKIIQVYRDQGLRGNELGAKIVEMRRSGIIK